MTVQAPALKGRQGVSDEDIIRWVERNRASGRPVHVLTSEPEEAERIAEVITRRTGPGETTLVTIETVRLPTTSVAVGTAAAMCFAYLRAQVRGEQGRLAAEAVIGSASALVVGVSAEERLYPCQIADCSGTRQGEKSPVLASLTLPEFFAKYASVHDFGPGGGATRRPARG